MAATKPFEMMATFKALLQAALLPDDQKFKLLVTGKTGEGKSALVNGILGKRVAEVDAGVERCTTEVTEYKGELHGVPITVFDSPGLWQGTTDKDEYYIADMKKKCQNLSLVLYCSKMTNNRLKDEDRYVILKLTAAFGQEFWEHAVLVLTFANCENVSRRDDRDEDEGPEPDWDDAAAWEELEKKRFEGRLVKWKYGFSEFIIQEVGVKRDTVERIPVVPAGDHMKTKQNMGQPFRLPDRENWFDEFWKACSLRMREKSYQLRELEHRIEIQAEERKRKELEKQAEEYKKIICTSQEEKKKEKSDKLDLLLDEKPKRSDLQRIFKSSAVHFKMIGTALDVTVADLYLLPDATTNNLIKVFERWTESNKDVTWRKIQQVCEDYPEELGQANVYLKRFFESDRAHDKYFK